MIRRVWLIAGTIFTEAVRRREIYAIVLITVALLLAASTIRFFDIEGLAKFYHEIGLKAMSVATALTVIVLGARQLPREFERRTIYTLLAKPLSRWEFFIGKYLGVVGAGGFCLALFMSVFLLGSGLSGRLPEAATFAQYVLLQMLMVGVMAALSFALSLVVQVDAAITIAALLYLLGAVVTNALTLIYEFVGAPGQWVLRALNYLVPQPALFDMSQKVVHEWEPVAAGTIGLAMLYAAMFIVPYLTAGMLLFRRRAL